VLSGISATTPGPSFAILVTWPLLSTTSGFAVVQRSLVMITWIVIISPMESMAWGQASAIICRGRWLIADHDLAFLRLTTDYLLARERVTYIISCWNFPLAWMAFNRLSLGYSLRQWLWQLHIHWPVKQPLRSSIEKLDICSQWVMKVAL
jgi:hypothetical protein